MFGEETNPPVDKYVLIAPTNQLVWFNKTSAMTYVVGATSSRFHEPDRPARDSSSSVECAASSYSRDSWSLIWIPRIVRSIEGPHLVCRALPRSSLRFTSYVSYLSPSILSVSLSCKYYYRLSNTAELRETSGYLDFSKFLISCILSFNTFTIYLVI